MTEIKQAEALAHKLDAGAATRSETRKYLTGTQPLAFLAAKARTDTKLTRMASNIPRLQVKAVAERLRVTGLTVAGGTSPELWAHYVANDLDQRLPIAFREALGYGQAYAIVWDRSGRAKPRVTIESADHVVLDTDPVTGETRAALKRVQVGNVSHAFLYLPDRVVKLSADGEGATIGWKVAGEVDNPLGVVPVVGFLNESWLGDGGVSEIDDLKPLVDALNKLLADLMVGSEYYARPRRWATGVELKEEDVLDAEGHPTGETREVNPFPEGDRMMISEAVEARFGSLPAADLQSYEAAVRVVLGQIMAVSALPAHYLGALTGQAPGADGLRAAEAALTALAESKQATFGRGVEAVGRLMHGIATGTSPDDHVVGVRWAEAATRSVAQEADATVKLAAAGLLPPDYALARLGYDSDQIAEIAQARRTEALNQLVAGAARTGGVLQ